MAAKYSLTVLLTAPAAAATSTTTAAAAAAGRIGGLTWGLDVNPRSILDLVHSFEYDHFAGFHAGSKSHIVTFRVLDRDGSQFGRLVVFNDIEVSPLRASLDGRCGHDHRIL